MEQKKNEKKEEER